MSTFDASVAALRQPLRVHQTQAWGAPEYTNWVDESLSWKQTCYLGDWSFLPALRYTGPDVLKLFADVAVNTMEHLAVGQSKHIIQCNRDGKIIEEGILSRFGEQEVVAYSTSWADYVRRQGDYRVADPERLELAIYHLQGPNSIYVLERAAAESLRDVRFMRFRTVTIAGHEVVALRQGMTGELGFELQAPREHGQDVWDAILEAGQDYGILQMGGRVGMINHLEASYPTHTLDYMPAIFGEAEAGYLQHLVDSDDGYMQWWYRIAGSFESDDISDWYRSPIELGWSRNIKLDHDFIGKDALQRELEHPRRTLVTLVWNAEDVMDLFWSFFRKDGPLPDFMEMPQEPRGYMYTDKVLKGGQLVGVTSSRGYSAYFREMLSLAVIDLGQHQPGTEVTVIWGNPGTPQREIRATVQRAPYKEDRARVDLATLPQEIAKSSR
jgi:vanillate/3-O-methylgallate O-demethylase